MAKKHFKKILSFMLSAVIGIETSVITFASETGTYMTNDGIIVDSNIHESIIENLPESMKQELQNDDSTLISVSTTYFDLETGMKTRAVMPESDFKLTVSVSRLSPTQMSQDGVSGDAFKFIATGEWIVNPTFEFTDCIGITWSDEFTLYDDYGYTYTKDYGGLPFYNYDALTLNNVSPEQGFAYDVDLLLFDRQDEITLIGKVYKPESSGSANVCATYGHVIVRASAIDVSFSKGKDLSIGMNVGIFAGIEMASPDYKAFDY